MAFESWEEMIARKGALRNILRRFHRFIRCQRTDFAYHNREVYRSKSPTHKPSLRWPTLYEDTDEFNFDPSCTPSPRSRVPSYHQDMTLISVTIGGSGGGAGWETGATGGSTEWNDNAGGSSEWNGDSGVTNGFTSGDARNYVGDDGPDVTVDDAGGNDGGCRNCGQGK